MKTLKRMITRTPVLGRVLLGIKRAKTASGYFWPSMINVIAWLFRSRETANFTYDLEEINVRYLAAQISTILGIDYQTIAGYLSEIQHDEELKNHVLRTTERCGLDAVADREARFGRRIGWYAIARATKPRLIVETGVDKGLGSCVLAAALKRNTQEGSIGKYLGTDLNPEAGYLLCNEYARFGSILFGDSIESLAKMEGPIDLFINDSDHSAQYEAREYEIVSGKLSNRAIVLGDNAHATDELLKFSLRMNRQFVFFQEKPKHWYPGAGIGISFARRDLPALR